MAPEDGVRMHYVYFRNRNEEGKAHEMGPVLSIGYYYNEEEKQLEFTAAFCSPKDRFNRKVARNIINGRYMKGRTLTCNCESRPKYHEAVQMIANVYNNYALGQHFGLKGPIPIWAECVDLKFLEPPTSEATE